MGVSVKFPMVLSKAESSVKSVRTPRSIIHGLSSGNGKKQRAVDVENFRCNVPIAGDDYIQTPLRAAWSEPKLFSSDSSIPTI